MAKKMMSKLFIMILTIIFLSITINADITDATIPHTLPNFITGSYGRYYVGVQDDGFARAYAKNTFGLRIARGTTSVKFTPFISRLYTGLETGKLYKWQYTFSDNLLNGVGDIAPTNNNYICLVTPANLNGHNLDPYLDSDIAFSSETNPYVIGGYTYSIPSDNYRMFYDSNNKTLTCIMILPDDYFNGQEAMQLHAYIMVALGQVDTEISENLTITAYDSVPLHVQGDYITILNQIVDKLDGISSTGISQEKIDQAIQDALTAHDELLEHEVGGKLDQIMEQINSIVSPYKDAADEINNAFDGLSDVFASSSTASKFKFPEGRMPNGVILWQEHNIDIGAAWNQLPAKFRSVVQIVCTFTILYIVIREAIFVIRFIILGRKGSADD